MWRGGSNKFDFEFGVNYHVQKGLWIYCGLMLLKMKETNDFRSQRWKTSGDSGMNVCEVVD